MACPTDRQCHWVNHIMSTGLSGTHADCNTQIRQHKTQLLDSCQCLLPKNHAIWPMNLQVNQMAHVMLSQLSQQAVCITLISSTHSSTRCCCSKLPGS